MDEIGISRSYRLAEKVASVVDEAQPLLAKIEALVEGVQPLLAEVRDSTLLNDVENLIKSLAEATVDLRKVQSAILTPENAELTRQSIFTLIFTLKNIEEFNQVLCQSCVRAAGAGSFRILPLRILFLNSSFRMLRDLRIFRRNSNTGKAPASEINNENLPVDPSGSSTSQLESDPSRAPLITIQEPVQNPNPGLDQGAISRRKPETTHFRSQVKGSDSSRLPFHTPEKMVSRQRFGWGLKGEPGMNDADNGDDLCYEGPSSQLPPLSRGGSICPGGGFGLITPRMYRTAAKASSVHSDCSSTQSTPTKSVTKPPSSGFSNSRPPVVIRVRPLSSTEKSLQGLHRCLKQESAHNISWIGQPETRFTFDYVACETINQEMLFRVAGLPMVENCMSGYNSCVFAYGQTGSGKTYTMLGEIGELEVRPSLNRGMTPRIFEFLFARIKAEEESRRDEKLKYSCKCSFLEIYNEQITDLLDPTSSNLLLREDIRKGVYVENLTEYVVENVNDILNLLIQGAANRKVAATNMNRESSRSHSVFTCIIESRWEKDSTVNLRFARLNLVDLAGSERQKTSGAEGERLKEAANINKSLSTLGHVIMVLADVAHGKHRHVPYRDSRLTFLLQDSLGGNSKTMIIANVSPSICSANETLSTLKFAQRARLVQNNAVVNEDASGDVISLRHQIHLLKEELSVLKRQNISRSLSFRNAIFENRTSEVCDEYVVEKLPEVAEANDDEFQTDEGVDSIRVSMKQLKSLEAILAGALRREKMADTTIKQLQAEIEQLNRLVRQREDDTQSTKMMLKFREDKIRWKIFWKARCQFQDFYKEGERELLLAEVIELRNKLMQVFDGKSQLDQHLKSDMETSTVGTPQFACSSRDNESLFVELNKTHQELKSCKSELQSCLEINERLTGEISNLRVELNNLSSANHVQHVNLKHRDIDMLELPQMDTQACEKKECLHEHMMEHAEEILNLQLELDILKTILAEEKSSFVEVEERANHTKNELKSTNGRILYMSKQYEDINNELKDARSIIEALESEHILLINEMEEARERCNQQKEILNKQEQEIFLLRNKSGLCPSEIEKQSTVQEELRNIPHGNYENEGSPLQVKLKKMQASLEKARDLNMRCQSDQVSQTSLEQEMDEVRRQVEIETAEVIVCLQEELAALQKQADGSKQNELIAKQNLIGLQTELKELHVRLHVMAEENEKLGELIEEKDRDLRSLTEDWERLACEIADILADGNMSLEEATDQVDSISDSFPKRSWIGEQIERIIKGISERDLLIEELQKCLEEAQNIRCDMEWKLRSLRGATLAITEAQQLESSDKEQEILRLTTEITEKMFTINELENGIEVQEEQIKKAELNATVAFMTVNKLSEMKPIFEIAHVKLLLDESKELKQSQEHIAELQKHSQNQERARELEQMKKEEEDVVLSVMDNGHTVQSSGDYTVDSEQYITEDQMKIEAVQSVMNFEQQPVASMLCVSSEKLLTDIGHKSTCENVLEYSHDRQSNIHHLQKELGIALDQLQYVQTQMALELEVSDAKAIAAHKTIEATHLLAKIEEAQGTMQDADIMVNMLLQANETAKCDIERLQNTETMLCYEKNLLIDEIQHLQSSLHTKEKEYTSLEKNFESNLIEARGLVLELEDSCRNLQTAFAEKFESLACDLDWIKSNLQDYTESIRSCLEKTCERNVKAKEELEICSVLKGKLLVDINNSFNRIAKKEDETAEFRTRLNSFEKEILQLQSQEESMLARSNSMGTELALLVKELDDNNMNTQTALLGQDKLLKEKEVLSKELDDMTRLLHEAHRVNEMFMDSLRGELALLTDEPHPKIQMKVDVPIIILELEQNAIKCNQMASHVSKLEKENDTMSSVIEKESASIAKDQEDELEQMVATMESLEDELASRSCELDEAIVLGKTLEGELIEKNDKILALELELAEKLAINSISVENFELKSHLQQVSAVKSAIQEELNGKLLVTGRLEDEILTMSTFIGERNHLIEDLQGGIAKLEEERDHLSTEVHVLKEKLDMAQALAEENEAIATEARQIAEVRKVYVEEKEEEVKLLERSVEELECTVFALENKVDIVRAEAEKHRLQREEIEIELHTMRDQLSQKNIQVLQKEIAKRDTEILQFKAHISELNMHAEAQAREYKQKFMELEAMAQQVNADPASSNSASLTSTKSDKGAAKPRGSSSPFKCIGLGLVQQMNSEKDELQRGIFMLNTRLAQAESMTHDVIRDLLGVKLDMTDQEAIKLRKELNEFIQERQSWLHEIKLRHTEMVDARMMAEKLRQREQFISTENEMLKEENTLLKIENEDLNVRLRRSEEVLLRVKEELARYRLSFGKDPCIDFDKEEQLRMKLQVAGLTDPTTNISPSAAEDAAYRLKDRINSLENEIEDLKLKCKLLHENIRLYEIRQQLSPQQPKTNDNFLSS
ncbi:KISc [Musa troglodytarum]|uniref:KISc n=1 Tax=Musa troglodytarum TaxID=320322 RepID=A0A9E7IAY1_9LILI|nr:KISc [Musa troglodytarum]